MGLFKKKLSDEELIQQNIAASQAGADDVSEKKKDDGLGDSKLAVEITKLKAQLEGLNEQRKATNERFSHISEEIGEIRGMIVETNKAVGRIEAAATKAIDLVQSVKPEELMIEVRKADSKIEALKANVESNETMTGDVMNSLKEMRKKMDFYKGVEQIAKMNEEIKKELIEIKKVESVIDRHSSKVETIFIDVEKKYTEFDKYGDVAKDLQRSFSKIQSDVDKLRIKIEEGASKQELVKLISKFNDFEKHTTNIINLLEEKSKSVTKDLNMELNKKNEEIDKVVNQALINLNAGVVLKSDNIKIDVEPETQTTDSGKTKENSLKKNLFGFLKKKNKDSEPNPEQK